jgi:hypothetical protein
LGATFLASLNWPSLAFPPSIFLSRFGPPFGFEVLSFTKFAPRKERTNALSRILAGQGLFDFKYEHLADEQG